jgi:hypothetical protein
MDSLSAYRPQRQRKSVSHYSDDNPNTFTVKVKKGDTVENTKEIRSKQQVGQQTFSGRKGIKRPHAGFLSTKHESNNNNDDKFDVSDDDDNVIIASLVQQEGDANGSASTPVSPRRGRPPKRTPPVTHKKGKKRDTSSSSSSRSSSPKGTINSSAPRTKMTTKVSAAKKTSNMATTFISSSSTVPNQGRRRKRVRILTEPSLLRSSVKRQDEIICHTAAIQTVLPAYLVCVNNSAKDSYEEHLNEVIPPRPIVSDWTLLESNDDLNCRQGKSSSSTVTSSRQSMSSQFRSSRATPTISTIPFDVTATSSKPDSYITAFSRRQSRYSQQLSKNKSGAFRDYRQKQIELDEWVVTGDCYGGVSLWKVGWGYQLCQLQTAASQREEGRIVLSKKTISFPNEILQTAWSYNDIVLVLSDSDLEGINVSYNRTFQDETISRKMKTQNRLFLVNLTPSFGRSLQPTQQFHFNDHFPIVLWSSDGREIIREESDEYVDGANIEHMASLLCLSVGNDTESKLISSTIHPDGVATFRCLAAVWDAYKSHEDDDKRDSMRTVIALAQTSPDKLEMLRINQSNQDKTKTFVSDRSIISLITGRSLNVAQMECTVQQVPPSNHKYTIVCGTRIAIQIFDSNSLCSLATFGKSVSLHGKTVQWQACHWVQSPDRNVHVGSVHDSYGNVKQQLEWLQREDEVATRIELKANRFPQSFDVTSSDASATVNNRETYTTTKLDEDNSDYHCFWLIGVPHSEKGPSELNSTLHVWKNPLVGIEGHEVDPILRHQQLLLQQQVDNTSLLLPKGGSLGLCISSAANDFQLLCATAKTGQLYQRISTFRTNFAGVMYPPSYSVIDDNIEYIEDESDMDQPIVIEEIKDESIDPVVVPTTNVGPKPRGRPRKNPLPSASNFSGDGNIADVDLDETLIDSLNDTGIDSVANVPNDPINVMVNAVESICSYCQIDSFQVPCWPTASVTKAKVDRAATRNGGAENSFIDGCAGQTYIDIRTVFKYDVLEHFPTKKHFTQIDYRRQFSETNVNSENTNGLNTMICSDLYSVCSSSTGTGNNLNGGSCTIINVSKSVKGKRTRMANVESMLQSSVDSSLRTLMLKERGRWSNGSFDLGARCGEIFRNNTVNDMQNSPDLDESFSSCAENGDGTGERFEEIRSCINDINVSTSRTMSRKSKEVLSTFQDKKGEAVLSSEGNAISMHMSVNMAPFNSNGCGSSFAGNRIVTNGEKSNNGHTLELKLTQSTSLEKFGAKLGTHAGETSSPAVANSRKQQNSSIGSQSFSQDIPPQAVHESTVVNENSMETSRESTILSPCDTVVIASESSLVTQTALLNSNENQIKGNNTSYIAGEALRDWGRLKIDCAACRGRFVVHSCGKRENPSGYDAARAERENTERKSAENARVKAEKRRQADAKRREAKISKKQEEDERKKREEEETRLIEEAIRRRKDEERANAEMLEEMEKRLKQRKEQQSYNAMATSWAPVEQQSISINGSGMQTDYSFSVDAHRSTEYAQRNRVPSYRAINQISYGVSEAPVSSATLPPTHSGQGTTDVGTHIPAKDSIEQPNRILLTIGGNVMQPSTPLDPSDALAALAGLADSMPTAHDRTYNETSLNANSIPSREIPLSLEEESGYQYDSQTTYEYSGSRERQAAIHLALAETQAQDYDTGYNTGYSEYYENNLEATDQIVNQGYNCDNGYLEESYSGDAGEYGDAIIGSARQHQSDSYWSTDLNG